MTIQVIALDWKWLFIYPGQNVASVNQVTIPQGTPVDFELTSDAVMSSFWVPQLGGQMYAMPGMATHLNLIADKMGSFAGSSANINGAGFSRMTFMVKSVSSTDFTSWVHTAHDARLGLTTYNYSLLSRPSIGVPVSYYNSVQPELYNTTVLKYMMPSSPPMTSQSMSMNGSTMVGPSL